MPNPFDKPKRAVKGKGYAFKPYGDYGQGPNMPSKRLAMPQQKRKGPKAGVDTRPNEREPKRVAPRQRMPKELAPMPPKRGGRLNPRPMPMPKSPKGDSPKARPMPMPRGPSKRIKPRAVPKNLKDFLKRKP